MTKVTWPPNGRVHYWSSRKPGNHVSNKLGSVSIPKGAIKETSNWKAEEKDSVLRQHWAERPIKWPVILRQVTTWALCLLCSFPSPPLFLFFQDKISLCSPGGPGTCSVNQVDLRCKDLLLLLPPTCWVWRCAPPGPTTGLMFKQTARVANS